MGRKSRIKRQRRKERKLSSETANDMLASFMIPGNVPIGSEAEVTKKFQENIRKSSVWKDMVDEFGEEEAEKLLRECKAEFR
jgi:hypothetical protein